MKNRKTIVTTAILIVLIASLVAAFGQKRVQRILKTNLRYVRREKCDKDDGQSRPPIPSFYKKGGCSMEP